MASKKGTNTTPATETNSEAANYGLSYGDFKIDDVRALPLPSFLHLANLGFSTALKNSIAGVKAGLKGESKTEDNNWSPDDIRAFIAEKGLAVDAATEEELRSDATIAAILGAYQKEMFESILSGNVGLGGRGGPRGPRLSPDEKLLREVAVWYLERLTQKLGKAMPKNTVNTVKGEDGKETKVRDNKLDAAIAAVLGNPKHREAIDEEFNRRKAVTVEFGPDDEGSGINGFLDELLG